MQFYASMSRTHSSQEFALGVWDNSIGGVVGGLGNNDADSSDISNDTARLNRSDNCDGLSAGGLIEELSDHIHLHHRPEAAGGEFIEMPRSFR